MCFHYGGRAQYYTKSMNCSHYTERGLVRILARTQENHNCMLNQENFLKIEEDILLCTLLEGCQKAVEMVS